MSTHRHISVSCAERPYFGPVSTRHMNAAAHGGVCYVETCRCGAVRKTNANGPHAEAWAVGRSGTLPRPARPWDSCALGRAGYLWRCAVSAKSLDLTKPENYLPLAETQRRMADKLGDRLTEGPCLALVFREGKDRCASGYPRHPETAEGMCDACAALWHATEAQRKLKLVVLGLRLAIHRGKRGGA